jgi:dihydrofolate reductase/thymidylate synthase
MDFSIVVAVDEKNGMGKDGKLPWRIPAELQYFAKLTKETDDPDKTNAVIMGRKSWESIPGKYRPLPNRLNIVMTRNEDYALPDGVLRATSLDQALQLAGEHGTEKTFVIGGAGVFKDCLPHPNCKILYVTEVLQTFECDTFLPEIGDSDYKRVFQSDTHEDNDIEFRFVRYDRI